VNTKIGGMSSDEMSDGLTGNQSALLDSPSPNKHISSSEFKGKRRNLQSSTGPTENATTRVD